MAFGNDSNTKALLHLDGTNGSTTITDINAGGSAHTWTNHTGAISTTQSKFGGASYGAGSTGYVDTPDSTDWTLGSGDFTIDFWFYVSGGSGAYRYAYGQMDSSGNNASVYGGLDINNKIICYITTDGSTTTTVTGATAITTTGWHHYAAVRTGNVIKLFLDGTQDVGNVSFSSAAFDSANKFSVCRAGEFAPSSWNGFVDEFRFSNTARWTANFTPPTLAYGSESLTTATGSYTLTGVAAILLKGLGMVAGTGAYVLSGVAATLKKALHLTPAAGAYVLTGVAQTIHKAWEALTVTAGAYTLTGIAATKALGMPAAVGTFTLTGVTQAFKKALHLTAAKGTFTLTGVAAILTKGIHLVAAAGSFVITGVQLVVAHAIAPVSKFKRRLIAPILYKVRGTAPTLED